MSFLSTVNCHLSTDQRATGGTRTHDPSLTKRLLCQLSYGGLHRRRGRKSATFVYVWRCNRGNAMR